MQNTNTPSSVGEPVSYILGSPILKCLHLSAPAMPETCSPVAFIKWTISVRSYEISVWLPIQKVPVQLQISQSILFSRVTIVRNQDSRNNLFALSNGCHRWCTRNKHAFSKIKSISDQEKHRNENNLWNLYGSRWSQYASLGGPTIMTEVYSLCAHFCLYLFLKCLVK